MTGRVYLVGAGPGDPGLLTRRGERCLAAADVVVHDYLVGSRLLELVRPGAEVIALGRSHEDPGRLDQHAIDALLVAHAREGRTVVRLKNGDPFLLGRGAEEAEALSRAGVPFEVVPGVSSAFAVPAYAGIPLTHRTAASAFTVVTGHTACETNALDWEALSRLGTLVVLMGLAELPAIASRLMELGRPAATPVAVICRGTTAEQVVVRGTLSDIAERARTLTSPATIVIGTVARLADQLAWFDAAREGSDGLRESGVA